MLLCFTVLEDVYIQFLDTISKLVVLLFTLKVCCYPVTASWVISYNYLITKIVAPLQAGGPKIQHTLQALDQFPLQLFQKGLVPPDKLPYPSFKPNQVACVYVRCCSNKVILID